VLEWNWPSRELFAILVLGDTLKLLAAEVGVPLRLLEELLGPLPELEPACMIGIGALGVKEETVLCCWLAVNTGAGLSVWSSVAVGAAVLLVMLLRQGMRKRWRPPVIRLPPVIDEDEGAVGWFVAAVLLDAPPVYRPK